MQSTIWQHWAATVLRNDWCDQAKDEEQCKGYVFSDASDEAEAFVLLQGEFITQAAQWNRTEENHIFLAETHALCEAFRYHGQITSTTPTIYHCIGASKRDIQAPTRQMLSYVKHSETTGQPQDG